MAALLEITDLNVHFALADGEVHAVKNASLTIQEGECLGVVGESGSGKSQLFLAAFGLLAANGRAAGSVRYRGEEILGATPKRLNALRGGAVTMIFQDPLTSLTPHMKVGAQITEALMLHRRVLRAEAQSKAREMLDYVRIPESARRLNQYPHELSGGMRQRVSIARALVSDPRVLLMDEPFGALDNITKADIHSEFKSLEELKNKTIILVTHDVQEAFELGHRICLMDKGKIIQTGTSKEILYHPENDFVTDFFAENRLLLEYKIATLKDVGDFLNSNHLLNEFQLTENTNVWEALQKLSSDHKNTDHYENLIRAFNGYRKLQIV